MSSVVIHSILFVSNPMPSIRIIKTVIWLLQALLIWLLVHFLLHTFVTFGLGIDLSVVRAWKEIIILVLGGIAVRWLLRYREMRQIWSFRTRNILVIACGVGVVASLLIHVTRIDTSLTGWVLAMRYDYLWFVLLLLGWLLTFLLDKKIDHLFRRYARVMKRCLVAAIVWRCIVAIKPGTLKLLGYNNYVFEGTIGEQPPAVYYTQINYGLPRNQFFFERPTTRWFWLTAFFPLFFLVFLRRRPMHETRWRWSIYGINVILTFSRAARGTWLLVALCTLAVFSQMSWKRLLRRYGVPLCIIFTFLLGIGRDQIMSRGYSNYGHITMIQRGREMFLEKPILGRWGASVGPGSHRGWLAFNPENQFLQVIIEFGIIGILPRLFLRVRCLRIGVKLRPHLSEQTVSNKIWSISTVVAFSLGMLSLTISGMVLHTFGDRMVVYPFMLLFGCAVGRRRRNSLLHSPR